MEEEGNKKKVLLGMSGGVDSAVSAILLQEQGYEVYGITLKLWEDSQKNGETDIAQDAKKVCDKLGIEHYVLDGKELFQKYVIQDFICQYKNCRTPNPCIECNKYLKFGYMYEKAKELGIDYIATGHYAKVEYSKKYQAYVIKKADNIVKDQSYVLYNIPKDLVSKVIFPLANMKSKEEIRQIAREHGLEVASKPDSEDICFIPDGDYKKFLEENSDLKAKEGNIVNQKEEILGKHQGLYRYTIGQRKGLGIAYSEPLFVIGFQPEKNELIVGTEKEIYQKEMLVNHINFLLIDKLEEQMRVMVKTRYSSREYFATIEMLKEDTIKVIFDEQVARITPGQSAVFYIDDIVLGGGKII
ncbi:MAG: tRNA 2-thiouridine(34) synthase MnmA [Clostridia bacterium]|nr:tRNA 2-thiouridine(34) synthase MnmA [Clostridia bacterium]